MSRLAVFIAVPALAAVAGLAVLCVDLAGQVDELKGRIDELEIAPVREDGAERTVERVVPARSTDARVRALDERLGVLEARSLGGGTGAASDTRSEETASTAFAADTPPPGDPAFRSAVEAVLEAREAERRRERTARVAEARTRQMLRDIEVTDAQRADVLRVVTDGLRRREESREMDLDPELARERNDELQGELERGLEGILDATQMETVRSRIGLRRGGGGRAGDRRPERGGRRGRGRADDA